MTSAFFGSVGAALLLLGCGSSSTAQSSLGQPGSKVASPAQNPQQRQERVDAPPTSTTTPTTPTTPTSSTTACDDLVNRLCAELGKTTETCMMVTNHAKKFPIERCNMMLERYDDVLSDLRRMEAANRPLEPTTWRKLIEYDAPTLGPLNAPVVLVVFSDFECPYCQKAAKALADVVAKYPSQVRLVFRHFPLTFHENAKSAAHAAAAAAEQGKFWQFHDLLFADQRGLGRDYFIDNARRLGLDEKRFVAAMNSAATAQRIDRDLELGRFVNVQGTPTVYLNGKRVQDATLLDSLSAVVEQALAETTTNVEAKRAP
jgi:protein-disulfide isomerase